VKFTDLAIRALPPPVRGQKTYMDKGLTGFGLRVSQGGTKTWFVVHGANRDKTTIGRYPIVSLTDARGAARRILAEYTLGKRRTSRVRFPEGLTLFLEKHCAENNRESTRKTTKGLLENHFLPSLRHKNLDEISAHDITKVTDRLLAQGKSGAANHAFTALRTMLRFCVRRRLLEHSPMEGMFLPARTESRSRVLAANEVKKVWAAAEAYGYPFGHIVRLLILTGQRRVEVGSIHAERIDQKQRLITLPAAITKNRREHTFPYGDLTASILDALPYDQGNLFRARGKETPFVGWSKSKALLDRTIEPPAPDYDLHDCRRTFATMHAAIGTPPHVTERLLNHVSGTISGVAAIYNRHHYFLEMRQAATAYENHLQSLLST